MKHILLITGSARPNSINKVVIEEAMQHLEAMKDVQVQIADLESFNLPYFDASAPPASPGFSTEHESVKEWSSSVKRSDAVVFVTPEYNNSLSGIQKNAIDWLSEEWKEKPAAFVGYGAYAAKNSYEAFLHVNNVIKTNLIEEKSMIQLGEVIGYDGVILNQQKLDEMLVSTLEALVEAV